MFNLSTMHIRTNDEQDMKYILDICNRFRWKYLYAMFSTKLTSANIFVQGRRLDHDDILEIGGYIQSNPHKHAITFNLPDPFDGSCDGEYIDFSEEYIIFSHELGGTEQMFISRPVTTTCYGIPIYSKTLKKPTKIGSIYNNIVDVHIHRSYDYSYPTGMYNVYADLLYQVNEFYTRICAEPTTRR